MNQKVNTIQELEDKLTELSKVCREENEKTKKKLNEWENKFKMMHDNLSSEIKLLTGKLNSMEEFRLQRDDLMAKFDTQEQEIKEQAKKHKAILYEMERKVILDKERMRKDVENKLLELSTEFTKTSDLRVAASTQRLVRENIALNNDMDKMVFTQERLQKETEEMKKKHREFAGQYEASLTEKKRLIKTCEQQLETIKNLTAEFDSLRDQNTYLKEIKRGHEVARKLTRDNRSEMTSLKEKLRMLEQHVHVIDSDRQQLKAETIFHRHEFERVSSIIKSVRLAVKSAIRGDKDQEDPAFRESQRKNLLTDLMNILNNLEKRGRRESLETIRSLDDFYTQGDLGIIPKDDADSIIKNMPKLKLDSTFLTPLVQSVETFDYLQDKDSFDNILDVTTASVSLKFESEVESEADSDDDDPDRPKKKPPVLSIDLRKSLEEKAEDDLDENKRSSDLEAEGEAKEGEEGEKGEGEDGEEGEGEAEGEAEEEW